MTEEYIATIVTLRQCRVFARQLVCAYFLTISVHVPLLAQEEEVPLTPEARAVALVGVITPLVFDPSTRSVLAGSGITPIFEVKKDGARAGLRVGLTRSDCYIDLRVHAPVEEDSGAARLADLSGFQDDITADAGITVVFWRPTAPRRVLEKLHLPSEPLRVRATSQPKACGRIPKAARAVLANGWTPAALDFLESSKVARPSFLTGRVGVGRSSFRFADVSSLEDEERRKASYSVEVGFGILFPDPSEQDEEGRPKGSFVQLAATYAEGFDASDPVTLCTPLPGTTSLTCRVRPFGAPSRRERQVVEIDLRRAIGEHLVVDPRLSWDLKEGNWEAELPIFLLRKPNPDEKPPIWSIGVSGAYRSEDHSFRATAFLSAILDLIPKP